MESGRKWLQLRTKAVKFVSAIGQRRLYRQKTAERGETTTVFLTVSASGSTDPSSIIFKGQRCPAQSLDISVFGPMKQCWRRKVVDYVTGTVSKPTRREFMNLLKPVFQESLRPENVNIGFRKQPYFLSTVKQFQKMCLLFLRCFVVMKQKITEQQSRLQLILTTPLLRKMHKLTEQQVNL